MALQTKDLSEIISHPYLIYKPNTNINTNMYTEDNDKEAQFYSVVNQHIRPIYYATVNYFQGVLSYLIDQERTKERNFFDTICKSDKIPATIRTNCDLLFKEGKYSELAEYLDAFKKNLTSDKKTVQEVREELKAYYEQFTFKRDEERIRKFFKQNPPKIDESLDTLFVNLENYLTQTEGTYNEGQKQILQKAVQDLKINFESSGFLSPHYQFTAPDFTVKNIKTKHGDKTLVEAIASKLRGLFGGKTGEFATGNMVIGMLTRESGKNPDTDVAEYWSKDMEVIRNLDTIDSKIVVKHYEDLQQIEQTLADSGGFAIHYSVKFGESRDIKIKGDANYAQRLEEIKQMLKDMQASGYEDFLFTFANTIKGFVAEDRWEEVKTSLIQFVSIWMFDDIIPNLQDETKQTKNIALNFYNIGGHTIVSSELFIALQNYLRSLLENPGRPRPTLIAFTRNSYVFPKEDIQTALIQDNPWEWVYERAMTGMKMGIKMQQKNVIAEILKL